MEIKTIDQLKNRVYDMMVNKDEEIRELNKRINGNNGNRK